LTTAIQAARRSRRILAALLCFLYVVAAPAAAYYYYEPLPQGPVGLLRPVISQQFSLGEGEGFDVVRMWLDGVEVTPSADESTGVVSYVPPAPLAPGTTHRVKLEVTVSDPRPGYFYRPLVSEFNFSVAADAVLDLPGPTSAALEALERTNFYREAAGLGCFAFSAPLGAASQRHASYQAATGILSHAEQPGMPLFFGETVLDRALYFCYGGGGVAEVIATAGSPVEAVDGWVATLYHRLPLLAPGSSDLGYGAADPEGMKTIHVVETGPNKPLPLEVAWPAPGSTGIPCSWPGYETPDPLRLYPDATRPLGYTITLTFCGASGRPVLSSGRLLDPNGVEVPVMSFSPLSPGNDLHLEDTVALIPRRPLLPGVTYQVELSGAVDLGGGTAPYHRSWSFTTIAEGQAFWDLPPSHPAYDAVCLLVSRGVVNGYEDGSFRPWGDVTRAEFSKLLAVAAAWPLEPGGLLAFSDTAGNWAAEQGFLQAAVRAGAVVGYPDGTFRPQGLVTRAEAVKMVAAAAGLAPAGVPPYADVDDHDWYAGWVAAAHSSALIGPGACWPLFTEPGFSGGRAMTRAEAAILVGNLLQHPR